MATRRAFLYNGGITVAAVALAPLSACSQDTETPIDGAEGTKPAPASGHLLERTIPATGERVPAIGLGTSGSFEVGAGDDERDPLREVLRRFVARGARVIDTAPTYGSAESVLGDLIAGAGMRDRVFLATKLSGVNGREEGHTQFEASLRRLRTDRVELLQVHNLGDTAAQFALALDLKRQGKTRYVGITHYLERAHDALADAMQAHKPDFVQINYSPPSRGIERRVLPLAKELGIAVLVNRAFEDGRLFAQVKGRALPAWAADVGARSWAQLFLKFALGPDAVTAVIPATSKPDNETDNLDAGVGPALDARQRDALVAALA